MTLSSSEHQTIILANGRFPESEYCLRILKNAASVICCDEAADRLAEYGLIPDVIIGDMDSLSPESRERFGDRMIIIPEQESNDLTKAVNFCAEKGYQQVTILGATGLREDHTLGNISLLLEYHPRIKALILTDHGEFSVLESGEFVNSHPGEKISFFSVDNRVRVTSEGLLFPLENMQLHSWWRASLNQVTSDRFVLHFESERPLLLFRVRE